MPLHAPVGYRCPFCRIAGGSADDRGPQEHVVHRYEQVIVKVNTKWWPNNRGSLIVFPVEHFENIYELPPRLGSALQEAARDAAITLKATLACDGISTRQHNEPAGNQDVWHYHVHVFPRFHDDELYRTRGAAADPADVIEMAQRLRAGWVAS
jgi:histidine triad (HIT) family protein